MSMVDVNGQAVDRWCPDSVIATVVRAAERLRLSEKVVRRPVRRARLDARGARATRRPQHRTERPDIRDLLAAVQPIANESRGDADGWHADAPTLSRLLGMLDERDRRIQMLESERAELYRAAAHYEAQLNAANQRIAYLQATRSRTSEPPPRPFLAF